MSSQFKLGPGELHAARKALYERSFKEFVRAAWHTCDPEDFIGNWHIDAICSHCEAVADGRIKRLIINVPPGSAKSMLISVMFPVWMWIRDPAYRIISTSYSMDNSTRDAQRSRDVIQSDWFQSFWPIELRDDENKKTSYANSKKGFRKALPLGSLTGARGNLVIVDDPHSVKTSDSELSREDAVHMMLTAVPSRLNKQARDKILVIQQRLHEEDVTGILLAKNLGYELLRIPMEWEGDETETSIGWRDPRTEEGELLFPELFPELEIERLKELMGALVYAGQYQQRPAPKDDGFFQQDWFKRYPGKDLPSLNHYITSDHAPSGRGDYNVIQVWGVDQSRRLWLVDQFRKRCELNEALGIENRDGRTVVALTGALALVRKYKPLCWFAENDHTYLAIRGTLIAAMRDTGVMCRLEAISTRGNKLSKAGAFAAKAQIGHVYLPEGGIGDDLIDELIRFPAARHDDQCDAAGIIARVINDAHPAFLEVEGEEPERPSDYQDRGNAYSDDLQTFW